MNLEKALQILMAGHDERKTERFLHFLSDKLWKEYDTYVMDRLKIADGMLKWNLDIPNAKENKEYNQTVSMPQVNSDLLPHVELELVDVKGLDEERHGLKLTVAPDRKSFTIVGIPTLEAFRKDGAVAESTFEITVSYRFGGEMEMPEDRPVLEHKALFVINQDPRKLWRDIPVDWEHMPEPKYRNADTQVDYVEVSALPDGTPQKDIVAASKRGRSHAQEGKPRDDYFKLHHDDRTGWYVMAVADGAGSAPYSREGARLACETAVGHCQAMLADSEDFEKCIKTYNEHRNESESEVRKKVGDNIYQIVGTAAFKAQQAIYSEAQKQGIPSKAYSTTLLLAICKRFDFGWFVASFWVGDGAICLYDRKEHMARILGVPDEGKFAGQTRFLTMPEIFKDAADLYRRLRFHLVDDFTALFLMSDGVSDAKFETDANLANADRWDALWDDLKTNGVDLTDDNERSKDQLLDWLDFWETGNHDDRTIAILYEGEENVHAEDGETVDSQGQKVETPVTGASVPSEGETEEKSKPADSSAEGSNQEE